MSDQGLLTAERLAEIRDLASDYLARRYVPEHGTSMNAVADALRHIDAQQAEIERLKESASQWEHACHVQTAEVNRLRGLLREAREALETTGPCEPCGRKCSAHGYNHFPCEVAKVLAKLAQEEQG